MDEPRDHTFREQWWKQILADREVTEELIAAALAISTAARRDGTRALMSRRQLAENLVVSEATDKRRTLRLQQLGYLQLVEQGRRRGDGTVTANMYELSLRVTQMTHRDTGKFPAEEISTGQNSVSTGHPGDLPLSLPSLIPPIVKRAAGAATLQRNHGPNDWRAKDRQLFRSVIGTDEVTYNDQSVSVEAFYEALLEKLNWPGKYVDEIDGRGVSGLDSYLESLGIERLGGWGPQLNQVARSADPWAAANDEDQKRREEPACKNCGVAKSRHDRWTTTHPFVAKKRAKA